MKAKNILNQPLVDYLLELSTKESNFNLCHAFKKASQSICLYPLVIKSKTDASDLNGVGVYMGQIIGRFFEKSPALEAASGLSDSSAAGPQKSARVPAQKAAKRISANEGDESAPAKKRNVKPKEYIPRYSYHYPASYLFVLISQFFHLQSSFWWICRPLYAWLARTVCLAFPWIPRTHTITLRYYYYCYYYLYYL
jgi:hypothetical protein